MKTFNLQLFGGRGSSSSAKGSIKTGGGQFEGKSTTALSEITRANMEEKLGLKNLTDGQQTAIIKILRGVQEYDYTPTYGGKVPSIIDKMEFKQPFIDSDFSNGRKYMVSVSIRTKGNTGNKLVDIMDTKYRNGMIGRKGGIFTYNDKGKKVNADWDVRYGTRM